MAHFGATFAQFKLILDWWCGPCDWRCGPCDWRCGPSDYTVALGLASLALASSLLLLHPSSCPSASVNRLSLMCVLPFTSPISRPSGMRGATEYKFAGPCALRRVRSTFIFSSFAFFFNLLSHCLLHVVKGVLISSFLIM